jgi:N-methylhydantoinase A
MANAIRRISAQRGADPRALTMVVYGGNGPVHATAQATELGIRTVLVPKTSPAFSALGLLLSDHVVDEVRAYISPAGLARPARISELFVEMERAARAVLAGRKHRSQRVGFRRFVQMCYPGQTFDIPVPVDSGRFTQRDLAATVERYHDLHEQLHTYAAREEEPIIRGLRLTATAASDKPAIPAIRRSTSAPPLKGRRPAFFRGRFVTTRIYAGPQLRAGHRIKGPAIIEEPFTTIVLHPGQQATLDRQGNYRIEL